MAKKSDFDLAAITAQFKIPGRFLKAKPYGDGHINRTFLSDWDDGGVRRRYIHQLINESVFKDVPALMANIELVLKTLAAAPRPAGNVYYDLNLIPAKSGALFVRDDNKQPWRTLEYLEGSRYFDNCGSVDVARESGRIVGFFQSALTALNPTELTEPIPNFTSSLLRLSEFQSALSGGGNRAEQARKEIDFVSANQEIANLVEPALAGGEIPRRIIHGDPKLNNILFDQNGRAAICMIDLDTCMPSYALYDLGDLVRNAGIAADEDEQDFSKIIFNFEFYEAILSGYLESAHRFLNQVEAEILHKVPQLLSFTLGVRFLTDFLNGDQYFKTSRKLHNLERARTQFKIFEIFRSNEKRMAEIAKATLSRYPTC